MMNTDYIFTCLIVCFLHADTLSAGSVRGGHCSHLQLLHTALSGHAEDLRCTGTHPHTHTHRFTGVVPLALQVWAEQTVIRGSLLESVPPAAQCCLLCSL